MEIISPTEKAKWQTLDRDEKMQRVLIGSFYVGMVVSLLLSTGIIVSQCSKKKSSKTAPQTEVVTPTIIESNSTPQ